MPSSMPTAKPRFSRPAILRAVRLRRSSSAPLPARCLDPSKRNLTAGPCHSTPPPRSPAMPVSPFLSDVPLVRSQNPLVTALASARITQAKRSPGYLPGQRSGRQDSARLSDGWRRPACGRSPPMRGTGRAHQRPTGALPCRLCCAPSVGVGRRFRATCNTA